MKVFYKLMMFTLLLSVFAGCKKDEDLPIADVAGTYMGTVSGTMLGQSLLLQDTLPITITYVSGSDVSLSVPGALLRREDAIQAKCAVTSTKDSYSFSGSTTLEKVALSEIFPEVPPEAQLPATADLSITVKDSSRIDKSGNADIDINVSVKGANSLMDIKFKGKKQ
jgi:hypothetical protein